MNIAEVWESTDEDVWQLALEHYWKLVKPGSFALEKELQPDDPSALRRWAATLDEQGWYKFLLEKYFKWKYTDLRRYATTTKMLRTYESEGRLGDLLAVRDQLLALDTGDIKGALAMASQIKGLGTAGASGLLSALYPETFGIVDQFVVKALLMVPELDEGTRQALAKMKPDSLSAKDGVLLIEILRVKAAELNTLFQTDSWTPRKVDMILWTLGR